MRNILSFSTFLCQLLALLALSTGNAFAQMPLTPAAPPCVGGGMAPTVGCASSADVAAAKDSITQAIGGMSQAVTDAIDLLAQAITDNGAVDDAAKASIKTENHVNATGLQSGAAALAAIQQYNPTYEDCAHATTKMLAKKVGMDFRTDTTTLSLYDPKQGTSDAAILIKGPPGGATAYRKSYGDKVQAAMKEVANGTPSYGDSGTFNPDMGQVKAFCHSDKCYNASLLNLVNGALISSTPERPPVNGSSNSQLTNYFMQRAQWGADRSEARETVFKLLPKMYKSKLYYTQALASFNGNANAATILNQEYPNSQNIGLSEYELQEAEFSALTASEETLVSVGQSDSQRQRAAETLQAAAAQLQIAKTERDAFDKALKVIENSQPPSLSIGAVGTTTSSP